MNLVLCGSKRVKKSSISGLILGQRDHSPESSPVCVRREGEVCGHLITLVEMPALHNTQLSEEDAMRETLHCVSLCDPGVHAFLLILPERHFTDEDRAEMEKIQMVFGSIVKNHTIFLITTETLQEALELDEPMRRFTETCRGGRYFFSPVPDVSGLIERVQQLLLENNGDLYTSLMAQTRRYNNQVTEIQTALGNLERRIQIHLAGAGGDAVRIVLLGVSGAERCSTGNTILGKEDAFRGDLSQISVTAEVNGRQITVIDTPGLFDSLTDDLMDQKDSVSKWISMVAPGPHVFLLVLKVGRRFSEEDKGAVKIIQGTFGERSVMYIMVLFSGDFPEKMSIEEYLEDPGPDVKSILEQCGSRYHFFNKETRDRTQVTALLEKIDSMVAANGGTCYTTEKFQQVEKEEQARTLRKRVEEIGREKEELKDKYEAEMERMKKTLQEEMQTERKRREEEKQKTEEQLRQEMKEIKEQYKSLDNKRAEKYEKRRKDDEERMSERENEMFTQMEKQREEFARQMHEDQTKREQEVKKKMQREEKERREVNEKHRKEREGFESEIEELKNKVQNEERRRAEEEKKQSDLEERMKPSEEKQAKELEELKRVLKIRVQEEVEAKEQLVRKHQEEMEGMRKSHEEKRLEQEMERKWAQEKFKDREDQLKKMIEQMERTVSAAPTETDECRGDLRVVLLGKCGTGISATGNTILGKNVFRSKPSYSSVTTVCERDSAVVRGRRITVIDTPGLFHTDLPDEEIKREILKGVSMGAPGPHAFLLVLTLGRFTQEEKQLAKNIQDLFGEESQKYTIVLFTRGDDLKETSIETFIKHSDCRLQNLILQCGNRYHVFNNTDPEDRTQVTALLEKIDSMVAENGGSFYTNEMFQQMEKALKEEKERILKKIWRNLK